MYCAYIQKARFLCPNLLSPEHHRTMLVFDSNWDCVADLYSAPSQLPKRLLFQLRERRQAESRGWAVHEGASPVDEADSDVWLIRRSFPRGWFISGGWVSMAWISRWAKQVALTSSGPWSGIAAFTSPHYWPLARYLKPTCLVYHSIDDYVAYWPKRRALTERREGKMVTAADLVICAGHYTADYLRTRFPDAAHKVRHIPNPVPLSFLRSQPACVWQGAQLAGTKARIGYLGAVNERFDVSAVVELYRSVPEAEIALPEAAAAVPELRALGRIEWLPRQPNRDDVVSLVDRFDICIVPQTKSHFNDCASPRKLWEFLGSSKAIVALNTPEADPLAPVVYSTHSRADFVSQVGRLVRTGEPSDFPGRRLSLARERTPSRLADRYARYLADACAGKARTSEGVRQSEGVNPPGGIDAS